MASPTTKDAPPTKLAPAKALSRESGIPYGSIRDAHFRGELAVVKIGNGDRHRAWYIDRHEFERWLETKRVQGGR